MASELLNYFFVQRVFSQIIFLELSKALCLLILQEYSLSLAIG